METKTTDRTYSLADKEGAAYWFVGALLQRKVIVRAMKGYNLPEWIRITIGTSQENNALLGGIKALLSSEKAA